MVEFALVAPILLMMLVGILAYGGYFWRAHSLQQVANDAARAALAGLTAAERAALARTTATSELPSYAGLSATSATVTVAETTTAISIMLDYDASRDPFFRLGVPAMPGSRIRRNATVLLGGL